MTLVRVLIADDEAFVRDELRATLVAAEGFVVVGETTSGGDAVAAAAELAPDVVIMGVRVGESSGIETTRLLREIDSPTRVLLLMSARDLAIATEGVRAGAVGFVLADSQHEDLLRSIKLVAEGRMVFDPRLLEPLAGYVCYGPRPRRRKGRQHPDEARLSAEGP